MSSPIRVAVLGVGAGMTFHVPFILALPDLFQLTAVLERNATSPGGKVYDRFGVAVRIHKTLDQVLADPEIELVIVATPNETHFPFAEAVLKSGKHVLVDKPVTATFAQAQELGALARGKGLVLYAFQNRRFDSDFLALRSLLALPSTDPSSLGEIIDFESHFDRYRANLKGTWKDEPRPAAGQTFDLGSHLIDQALNLFGRPARVTAFVQNVRGVGNPLVDDSFTIYLHYNGNPKTIILRAHILSVRSPQPRYIVRGTQGTFEKFGIDVQEDQLKAITAPSDIFKSSYGHESTSLHGNLYNMRGDVVSKSIWPSETPGQYVELFKNLAGAIRNGDELVVKWTEAATVIQIIELAHQSSQEGRTLDVPAL